MKHTERTATAANAPAAHLIDFHVHFFPESIFRAIWRFFDTDQSGLWKVRYRISGDEQVRTLRQYGVKQFTTLVYAHKPGLAAYLNDYIKEWADRVPEIIPFGTVYAGDADVMRTARRMFDEYSFAGIKLHPFVSGEEIDDPRFFPLYELMEATGRILVCHPGSGPVYAQTDGAKRLGAVLVQFPNLKVVVAHCGAFEYADYPLLADRYSRVYFDTAMNCVHGPFENNCPGRGFFERFQDRILYGSDFPNIPYPYEHQASGVRMMNLGPDIERKIFSENASALIGGLTMSQPKRKP